MKKQNTRIVLLSLFLLAGCSNETSSYQKYSDTSLNVGFDTFFAFQGWMKDEESFQEEFTHAKELFANYNELFDIYATYEGFSNLKTINDNAGIQPIEVEPVVIELLEEARYFYELSHGEFDITSGNLLHVWHTYRQRGITENEDGQYGKVPSLERLQEAYQYSGWEYIEIDPEQNTVFITDPNVSLDVGGIAKGFSVEKVAQALSQDDIKGAALNAGGNNRTLGPKYDGSNWVVRIQNPNGGSRMALIEMPGIFSFVTSGDYERYYIGEDQKRYHHIIDPSTLYPANFYRSVTIVTEDSGAADCLSTTLFTLSIEEGNQVLEQYKRDHPGQTCEAVWIMDVNQKDTRYEGYETSEFYVVVSEGLQEHFTIEVE